MRNRWSSPEASVPIIIFPLPDWNFQQPVVCLDPKSDGKSGKHSAVTDAWSVTTLSHVGFQVVGPRWFTHVPEEAA